MIKIRLHGIKQEAEKCIEALKERFDLLSVSGPYNDRGESKYVRYYIDAVTLGQTSDCVTKDDVRRAWEESKKENLI